MFLDESCFSKISPTCVFEIQGTFLLYDYVSEFIIFQFEEFPKSKAEIAPVFIP